MQNGNALFTTDPLKHSDQKFGRYRRFPDSKSFLFLWVSSLLLVNKKCARHFRGKIANENEQFKKNSKKSNSYFIRQIFQGYRCKSGISVFAWRVAWNHAFSPFNLDVIITVEYMTTFNNNQVYLMFFSANGTIVCLFFIGLF